jgi:hypothetical protein
MIHPDTELRYINDEIGFGVFATNFIPKGTITWALDELDQIMDRTFIDSLDEMRRQIVDKYAYQSEEGKYVLCWDIARFVNHSFHANCVGTAYDFDIAARDIFPGEELTNDYGALIPDEPFDCFPEAGSIRLRVMPDDMLYFYREWDRQALEAIRHFHHVAQPLKHLLAPENLQKVKAVAEGREKLDSILTCYEE